MTDAGARSSECVLRFPATHDAYAAAAADLRRALDARPLASKLRYKIELVFEEVVTNVIRHGARDRSDGLVKVAARLDDDAVVLEFEDNGAAFDIRNYKAPPLPRTLEEAGDIGLGIILVRNAASRIDYERAGEWNRLAITIGAE